MTGSAHGGPADDNDVGGVFRVCVGVEESARSAPLMWGVFDEPLTDHDLLVLSRAFDFGSVKPTLTYERGALIREEVQTFSLWPLLLNGYRYSKARGVHVQHQCSGCGS